MVYENPSTGEKIVVVTKTYGQPGHAKGMVTRTKREFYYSKEKYDKATRSYVPVSNHDRFPLIDFYIERAKEWARV